MVRFSQIRYGSGPNSGSANPVMRVIAALVGLIILGVSIFVGAIFVAGILGMAIIGGVALAIRGWLLRRKMETYAREHGDLEAEYTVIDEPTRKATRRPLD